MSVSTTQSNSTTPDDTWTDTAGTYTASDLTPEISLDDQGSYSNKFQAEAHNADTNNADSIMDILDFNMVWGGQPLKSPIGDQ